MDDLLQKGITAYKAGKRDEARNIFITLVEQTPDSERAWEWMYNVCNTDKGRIHCLKQITRINPNNEKANQLLARFTKTNFSTKQLPQSAPIIKQSSPQLAPTPKPESTNEAQKPLDLQKQKNLQIGIIATIFLCVICICLVVFNPSSGGGNPTPTAPAFTSPTQQPSIQLPTQPQQSVCNPSYPTTCLNNNPRLNCVELRAKGIERFQVLSPDPLGYDTDGDGIGCE